MTNSFRRFALKALVAAALAAAAGCDEQNGLKELEQARAAYGLRDLQKAEKLLEKSLERKADNVDALVLQAQVKLDLGRVPDARAAVDRALAIAGADSDVRLLDAQIAFVAKDYARAVKTFAGLADDTSLAMSIRSQGLSGIGVVQMADNENDLARLSFLKAIRLDRKNPAAYYHLGLIYRGLGFNEAALEQFKTFVWLEKKSGRREQEVQRDVIPAIQDELARRATERPGAMKRDSTASAKAFAEAEAAWKKGQYKTAKQKYQEAFDADALSYSAALGLAKAWAKTDATPAGQQKTFECYKTACSLRSSSVSTFITTGDLALKLKQYATAVEVYSRAMAADPSSLQAVDGLIKALRKTGGQNATANAYQAYRDLITPSRR